MEFIKLEKPIFIEDSFIAPLFNEEFEKVLTEISEHLESDIEKCYPQSPEDIARIKSYIPDGADRDDNLVGDTRFIIAEIVRINRELLARIPFDIKNGFAYVPTDYLNPFAWMSNVFFANKPYMSNSNCGRAEQCMRQIQIMSYAHDEDEEDLVRYCRLSVLMKFLIDLTGWNINISDDWENYNRSYLNDR